MSSIREQAAEYLADRVREIGAEVDQKRSGMTGPVRPSEDAESYGARRDWVEFYRAVSELCEEWIEGVNALGVEAVAA